MHILPKEDPRTFEVRWSEPKDNGSPITSYTMYRRIVNKNGKKNEWVKETTLSNAVSRSFTVILDWGKHYEFVVTATNSLGEAKKEENKIKDIQVEKGRTFSCFGYVCKALQENPKSMFIIESECGWCTLLFKKVILTVWSIYLEGGS